MKTAVISDIHANIEALQAVVDHAREVGVEEYVCLGDIVGYNADPGACIDLLRNLPNLRCILGNHDAWPWARAAGRASTPRPWPR